MRGSVGVYLPAMVEGKVFIIKLSGDKRVLLCVYVCVVYGTYWQVVCVSGGLVEKKGALEGVNSCCSYDPPIITTALATKH